jgi:DNA-binding NarL/FixJ family response regulator
MLPGTLAEPLTDREPDVVRLVALGRTNAEIAAEPYVSLSTVKRHLSSVRLELGARNRVETAAWAWQHGYGQPRA